MPRVLPEYSSHHPLPLLRWLAPYIKNCIPMGYTAIQNIINQYAELNNGYKVLYEMLELVHLALHQYVDAMMALPVVQMKFHIVKIEKNTSIQYAVRYGYQDPMTDGTNLTHLTQKFRHFTHHHEIKMAQLNEQIMGAKHMLI